MNAHNSTAFPSYAMPKAVGRNASPSIHLVGDSNHSPKIRDFLSLQGCLLSIHLIATRPACIRDIKKPSFLLLLCFYANTETTCSSALRPRFQFFFLLELEGFSDRFIRPVDAESPSFFLYPFFWFSLVVVLITPELIAGEVSYPVKRANLSADAVSNFLTALNIREPGCRITAMSTIPQRSWDTGV